MLQASYLDYVDNSGRYFVIDADGYLCDPAAWNRDYARAKAGELGITLDERHWQLIYLIRDKYLRLGALPPMRSVCKAVGFEKHELKHAFGSCLALWKLAGLPDPGEEAKTYMS